MLEAGKDFRLTGSGWIVKEQTSSDAFNLYRLQLGKVQADKVLYRTIQGNIKYILGNFPGRRMYLIPKFSIHWLYHNSTIPAKFQHPQTKLPSTKLTGASPKLQTGMKINLPQPQSSGLWNSLTSNSLPSQIRRQGPTQSNMKQPPLYLNYVTSSPSKCLNQCRPSRIHCSSQPPGLISGLPSSQHKQTQCA